MSLTAEASTGLTAAKSFVPVRSLTASPTASQTGALSYGFLVLQIPPSAVPIKRASWLLPSQFLVRAKKLTRPATFSANEVSEVGHFTWVDGPTGVQFASRVRDSSSSRNGRKVCLRECRNGVVP